MRALVARLGCAAAHGCCLHPLASDQVGDDEVGHLLAVACCRCEHSAWVEEIPAPRGECARADHA